MPKNQIGMVGNHIGMMDDGSFLQKVRESRGITRKELAKEAGLSEAQVYYYEVRQPIPTTQKGRNVIIKMSLAIRKISGELEKDSSIVIPPLESPSDITNLEKIHESLEEEVMTDKQYRFRLRLAFVFGFCVAPFILLGLFYITVKVIALGG